MTAADHANTSPDMLADIVRRALMPVYLEGEAGAALDKLEAQAEAAERLREAAAIADALEVGWHKPHLDETKRRQAAEADNTRLREALADDDRIMAGYVAVRKMLQMRVGDKHAHAEAFRAALATDRTKEGA